MPGFRPFDEAVFSWRRAMTLARLEALVGSRSPFLIAESAEQERTLVAVRELVGRFAGPDGSVELAYRTHCYRTDAVA